MSILNLPEHKKYLDELSGYVNSMEACMATEIDYTLIDNLNYQLSKAITLLALQGRTMELAAYIFDCYKGKAVDIVRGEDLKQDILRLKLSGLLAAHSARFDRAERTTKALSDYIRGLITLISAAKEHYKNIQQ